MTTNTSAWRQRWPGRCYSGSVATAGDLLFIGRGDGRFMAYDSDNGMPLWEFQTGAGVNTTPAIFEHEDEQYVAVFSAGNAFASSPRGDSVWLFSLNGALDPVEAPPPSAFIGAVAVPRPQPIRPYRRELSRPPRQWGCRISITEQRSTDWCANSATERTGRAGTPTARRSPRV